MCCWLDGTQVLEAQATQLLQRWQPAASCAAPAAQATAPLQPQPQPH